MISKAVVPKKLTMLYKVHLSVALEMSSTPVNIDEYYTRTRISLWWSLALDDKFFKPSDLLGNGTTTGGQLIYDAIKHRLKASNVGSDAKRDKLMSEFSIIRASAKLNEIGDKFGKTPLKFYTEFMSYSGGDGQALGIILTPRHICDLFCDLLHTE